MHTWIWYDGRHYDAECMEGVSDHRDLPFFERHPEAAVRVEPETTDGASLRDRGRGPLYPAMFSPESPGELSRVGSTTYLRHAAVGVLLGLFIFAIGMGGEWAMHRHLLRQTAELHGLFVDFEVIALVSPIIFFVLLPAHRASSR